MLICNPQIVPALCIRAKHSEKSADIWHVLNTAVVFGWMCLLSGAGWLPESITGNKKSHMRGYMQGLPLRFLASSYPK